MVAIIHPGRCDQALECTCPQVCPTGAWHRDKRNKRWLIDRKKCINCGLCVKECPANAIFIAKTPEEEKKIKEFIKNDSKFNIRSYLWRDMVECLLEVSLMENLSKR